MKDGHPVHLRRSSRHRHAQTHSRHEPHAGSQTATRSTTPPTRPTGWGQRLLRSPAWVLGAMLAIALVVELTSDALRRLFLPDIGGITGVALGLVWLPLLLGGLLWKLIVEPLHREQHASVTRLREQRRQLEAEAQRLDFDARLLRALEMADDEEGVFEVTRQALGLASPGRPAELLLASSDDASLARVATADGHEAPGCPVARTGDCPAVRQGRSLVFDSSENLATCPKLRHRAETPLAATCMPVAVMGRSIGVVHTTRPVGQPEETIDAEADRLASLATRAGARIELIRALDESREQAATDPLTGLANRRTLEARYRQLERDEATHAVLACDLDRFKQLNDTHGHDVGDQALVHFARVLARASRPGDLVGRSGGEEFVLVLPRCDRHEAVEVGERIRTLLADSLATSGVPPFTVSIGTADTAAGEQFEDVVRVADAALYEAKRTGRDRVVVGPGVRPEAVAVDEPRHLRSSG